MVDWVGKTLGQYEVTGLIGHGGMSTVYRAHQLTIQREVAIKVLNLAEDADPDFVARFEREVRIIASLEHLHILPIYDYGQFEGHSYLVMRFLDGGSLNTRIRQRPLALSEIERLITQIASALDYAHERGVVHRDMKPHNILLDKQGNAYLSDFGIAKLISSEQVLTQTGVAVGTPSYMAPEQWQGNEVDASTDVYALGVMLFELLTGQVPFVAENMLSLMYKQLNSPPPLVSNIRPSLPSILDVIIQQAMAKNPTERFASGGALAAAVSGALNQSTRSTVVPLVPTVEGEEAVTYVVNLQDSPFVGRTWVFDAFNTWCATGRTPAFCLIGPNGIGKSELAHRFVETLGERVLSYELVSGQAHSLEPHVFIDTIAAQLDKLLPDSDLEANGDVLLGVFTDPLEAFERRVLQPLRNEDEPLYLLIDGLECAFDYPGTTIADVLERALNDLPDALPDALRLIITAAPDVRLDRLLRAGERLELQSGSEEARADLLATLSTRFATLLPNIGKAEVDLADLQEKSAGNPLYLRTVFEHLVCKRLLPADLPALPSGLDALYADLIKRAEQQNPEAKAVLLTLTVARSPLSNELLSTILDQPIEQINRHLLSLSPLIRQIESQWELSHPALRYWLVNERDAELKEMHGLIAKALSQTDVAQMQPYALHHLPAHFVAAGQLEQAYALLADLNFLEIKLTQLGLNEIVTDFNLVRSAMAAGQNPLVVTLEAILAAIHDTAASLVKAPASAFSQLYNRLSGDDRLSGVLASSVVQRRSPWLRLQWPLSTSDAADVQVVWQGSSVLALAATTYSAEDRPRSRWLAACRDGYMRIWDRDTQETGKTRDTLTYEWMIHSQLKPESGITCCAISPDAKLALTGFEDGTAAIWEPESGRTIHTLSGHQQAVTACVFGMDGRYILTASEDRLLRLWDTQTGKLVQSFYTHPAAVRSCAFVQDIENAARWLALSGDADGKLRVWDIKNNQLLKTLEGHHTGITACLSLHDGQALVAVTGSADGQLCVWDLHTGGLIRTLNGHTACITALSVMKYDSALCIASASEDHTIRLWNLHTGSALTKIEAHTQAVTGCVPLSEQYLITASLDGTLRICTIRAEVSSRVVETHGAELTTCAFLPDSKRVLTASLDRDMRLWDAQNGRALRVFKGHLGGINCCAVRADGQVALSASTDGTLRTWDVNHGTMLHLLRGHSGAVMACVISPQPVKLTDQERWLALSGGADRLLRVWDMTNGQVIQTLKGHGDTILACAFNPTGQQAVSISKDRTVRVWSLADQSTIATLTAENSVFTACAFHPNGNQVILGQENGCVLLFDQAKEMKETLLDCANGCVSSCGFSANKQLVYATFTDGAVRVWSTRDRQLVALLYLDSVLTCGALAPDNTRFIVGEASGKLFALKLESYPASRRKTRS